MKIVFFLCMYLGATHLVAAPLRVMSYNMWEGGNGQGSLKLSINTIKAANADIIGLQETNGRGEAVAKALNYFYHAVPGYVGGGAILSRYPIVRTLRHGVELSLGEKIIYFFSIHLIAHPYEPYLLRDGEIGSPAEAIASASGKRSQQLKIILSGVLPHIKNGETVFLVGDFNEPSHFDWTEKAKTAGLHTHAVAWPQSLTLLAAGFKDAFRMFYPDEIKHKGYTWSPYPYKNELHDRIDFIYFSGIESPKKVEILGEQHGPEVDIAGTMPFPSDHRGVIAEF